MELGMIGESLLTGNEGDPYLHPPEGGETDEVQKLGGDRGIPVCSHDYPSS